MSATLILPSVNTQYFCLVYPNPDDTSITTHEALRELSEWEFVEINSAIKVVNDYFRDTELLLAIHMNHEEYRKMIALCKDRCEQRKASSYFFQRRMFVDINRCILNFLSTVRTFLDHHETELKHLGTEGEQRLANFEKATSTAFDTDFSYRFLSKLRNYVQHCGLPLSRFGYRESLNEDGSVESRMSVMFNRDALLSSFRWGLHVAPDLRAQPESFDITPHVDRMLYWANRIQDTLSMDLAPGLTDAVGAIERFMMPAQGRFGMPCICIQVFNEEVEGNSTITITHLPLEQVYILNDTVLKGRRQFFAWEDEPE